MIQLPNIQYDHFVKAYLPPMLRKPRMLALLRALLFPWATLYQSIIDMGIAAEKEANFIPQVAVLEWNLNERFDGGGTAIYITHATEEENPIVYWQSESQAAEAFLDNTWSPADPVFIFWQDEILNSYKYLIHIPTAIWTAFSAQIIAYLNSKQIAGTCYLIVLY